jgi:hypothetical protein
MLDAHLFPQPQLLPQNEQTLYFMLDGYLSYLVIFLSQRIT